MLQFWRSVIQFWVLSNAQYLAHCCGVPTWLSSMTQHFNAQIVFLPSLSCNSLSYYHTHGLEIFVIPESFIFQLKSRFFLKEGLTFFPNPNGIHMRSCSSSQRFHSIHDCHGCLHLTDWFICQRVLQQPQRTNLLTCYLFLKTWLKLPPRICYFFRITILKGDWFHRLPNTSFILFLCHSCCGHSCYRTRGCQGEPTWSTCVSCLFSCLSMKTALYSLGTRVN